MATHEVRVDYARTLGEEPGTGHNRWHPDIPPVVRCDAGEEVVLQTRDAFDGQMGPQATLETVAAPNLNVVHPLTGPVYVTGILSAAGNNKEGAKFYGGVVAGNVLLDDLSKLSGQATIEYSSCAIKRALQNTANPTAVNERSWVQLYN